MNKFFQVMGILTLFCFSFFYTQKTSNVVKEYDLIMKQIKQVAGEKQKAAKNATIIDNKIIPGKMGYEVNINKSYYKMKQYGKYEESLLVYKNKKPTISYHDNLDKYVSGEYFVRAMRYYKEQKRFFYEEDNLFYETMFKYGISCLKYEYEIVKDDNSDEVKRLIKKLEIDKK